jgi:pimeloyl-ACP methyl ester carboxylesterase
MEINNSTNQIITFKGIQASYSAIGKGSAVVLLHGFLEEASMWNPFLPELSKRNKIITIDLLGHGKTDCLGYIHTMEDHALLVAAILKKLKLRKYTFVGHSMGGYVALAFAKLFPNAIKGICLLNSTYKPDSRERKQLRIRANKMAQTNLKNLIKMSFANLFSEASKQKFKSEYENALKIALQTSVQSYIASSEGMILRKDFSSFFAEAAFKKCILLGQKDTLLDTKSIINFANLNQIPISLFSEGHMSIIENQRITLERILLFVN